MNQEKNKALADDLKKFLIDNDLQADTSIYFNDMCYRWDYKINDYIIIEGIKGSTYFEYANDETVSMSFEGSLYHLMNYGTNRRLLDKFDKLFSKHKCYYELGYAWSLSVYFD